MDSKRLAITLKSKSDLQQVTFDEEAKSAKPRSVVELRIGEEMSAEDVAHVQKLISTNQYIYTKGDAPQGYTIKTVCLAAAAGVIFGSAVVGGVAGIGVAISSFMTFLPKKEVEDIMKRMETSQALFKILFGKKKTNDGNED